MKILVVAVGRIKDPALRDACAEYERRIQRYLKFEIREVRDGGTRGRDATAVRRAETASLCKAIATGPRTVALAREGLAEPSRAFARRVAEWLETARDVAVLIGGAHGLDRTALERADGCLSLSPFTLSHEIARLVFLEQLYRACTILRGEPYHKGSA